MKDIEDNTRQDRIVIREYFKKLLKAGFIAQTGETFKRKKLYVLTKTQDEAPKLQCTGETCRQSLSFDHMWRTIKMNKGSAFTAKELAILASTDEVKISINLAARYITALKMAGYIKNCPRKKNAFRFLSSKNTGPKAPTIKITRTLFDPNTNQKIWEKEGYLS